MGSYVCNHHAGVRECERKEETERCKKKGETKKKEEETNQKGGGNPNEDERPWFDVE